MVNPGLRSTYLGGRSHLVGAAAAIVICGILTTACGGSPANSEAPRSPAGTAAQVKLSSTALSIIEYSGGPAQTQALLDNALEAMTARCMQARHLVYYEYIEQASEIASGVSPLPEFPLYTTLAERQADGYGLYQLAVANAEHPEDPSAPSTLPEDVYIASLPPTAQASYYDAYWGTPGDLERITLPNGTSTQIQAGGCRGQAARRLYGSIANYVLSTTGAGILTDELIQAVQSDSRFAAALRAWSNCMARRGQHYTSPWSAYRYFGDQYAKIGPVIWLREREISTAVADWQCAAEVSLTRVTAAIENSEAGRLGRQLEGDLLRLTQIDLSAASRARLLVSNG